MQKFVKMIRIKLKFAHITKWPVFAKWIHSWWESIARKHVDSVVSLLSTMSSIRKMSPSYLTLYTVTEWQDRRRSLAKPAQLVQSVCLLGSSDRFVWFFIHGPSILFFLLPSPFLCISPYLKLALALMSIKAIMQSLSVVVSLFIHYSAVNDVFVEGAFIRLMLIPLL